MSQNTQLRFDYLLACVATGFTWGLLMVDKNSIFVDTALAIAGTIALFAAGWLGSKLWYTNEEAQPPISMARTPSTTETVSGLHDEPGPM